INFRVKGLSELYLGLKRGARLGINFRVRAMHSLIITIIAIALTAALIAVTIDYLPVCNNAAAQVERQVKDAFPLLENAYDVATRAADGVAPPAQAGGDGGFVENFIPLIKFAPATPAGYTWVYGQHPDDGSHYANL